MNIQKMNVKQLVAALCTPWEFETQEEHMAAFKRWKNLKAK